MPRRLLHRLPLQGVRRGVQVRVARLIRRLPFVRTFEWGGAMILLPGLTMAWSGGQMWFRLFGCGLRFSLPKAWLFGDRHRIGAVRIGKVSIRWLGRHAAQSHQSPR